MVSSPVFDTNILIDWLRNRPGAQDELSRYERHRISRITWAEVLAGEPAASRDMVRSLMSSFEIVEVDERICAAAADIRHRTKIKLLDALILATAQVNGAVLVTRNTKDFAADAPGIHVPYQL